MHRHRGALLLIYLIVCLFFFINPFIDVWGNIGIGLSSFSGWRPCTLLLIFFQSKHVPVGLNLLSNVRVRPLVGHDLNSFEFNQPVVHF